MFCLIYSFLIQKPYKPVAHAKFFFGGGDSDSLYSPVCITTINKLIVRTH